MSQRDDRIIARLDKMNDKQDESNVKQTEISVTQKSHAAVLEQLTETLGVNTRQLATHIKRSNNLERSVELLTEQTTQLREELMPIRAEHLDKKAVAEYRAKRKKSLGFYAGIIATILGICWTAAKLLGLI